MDPSPTATPPGPARGWFLALLAASTLVLAGATYWYYRAELDRLEQEHFREASAIGQLKAGQIAQWRQERLADVRRPADSPFFRRSLASWAATGFSAALAPEWRQRLELERAAGFADALLFAPDGRLLLSAAGTDAQAQWASPLVASALARREPVLSDLFRTGDGRVYLDAAAPVFDLAGVAVAVFVQRSDARAFLFPLVQSWPTPSTSAESYLVARDGDDAVVLTPLRGDPEAALARRYPLALDDRPAVQAVRGRVGAFRGLDYRGALVLADLRPIAGSPWFQVAKVDATPVIDEARTRAIVVALIGALCVLLTTAAVAASYRHRQARLYRDLYESERQQRETQQEFRTALYSIGDAVITTDQDGHVRQMNPVAERLTGWAEADAARRPLDDVFVVVHEDTRERMESPVARVLRERTVVGLANHALLVSRDAAEHPISDSAAPIREADGTVSGTVLVFSDRTAERAARRALRASEERYRLVSRLSSDFAYECVTGGREPFTVEWITEAFFSITGYSREDLDRHHCWMFVVHPDDQQAAMAPLASLQPGEHDSREFRILTRDGQVRWLSNKMQAKAGPEPGNRVVFGAVSDITARKQAEEARDRMEAQLLQGQKMEAVGRLAGGVAHDFNNVLQTILGYTDMALSQLEPGHPVRADIEEIDRAAQRSAELTRQLLAFARKQAIAPRVLDLNATIASTLKMLRRLIGEDIELRWQPADGLPLVKMDPGQVDQVLANLVVNARDAIAGRGRITIETAAAAFDEDHCRDRPGYQPGRYVVLAVSDDGCGMDSATLARLFEPFFTTKPQGQGTGLGLSTVYGVVRQNDGFVNVQSEPGRGTTFRLYFPQAPAASLVADDHSAVPRAAGGTETILLVEDDEAILRLSTRLLTGLGYRVLPANRPEAALELAARREQGIDLLVTDVVMPGMSGRELWQHLHALRPSVRCLFTSGYTANEIEHHGVLHDGVQFLQKPFSRDALARKVREALDAPRA